MSTLQSSGMPSENAWTGQGVKRLPCGRIWGLEMKMLMVLLAVVGSMQLAIVSLDTSIGDEDAAAYALLGKSVKDGHGFSSRVVWLFFTRYDQPEHPEESCGDCQHQSRRHP